MGLYVNLLKRQLMPMIIAGTVYLIALGVLIVQCNSNSMIFHKIDPYIYGSKMIDFFWGLLVTIPFAISTFFMKKNNFLDYVPLRISKKKYLRTHIMATLTLCFAMVLFINVAGVIFSGIVADIYPGNPDNDLSEYILGNMQMNNPILFALIWSVHKALIGAAICLFAQIIALYVDNLFLALLAPYAYIVLENFLTDNLGIPEYSLTTTFALNRLQAKAMHVVFIAIGMCVFLLIIMITNKWLRSQHEKKC